MIMIHKVLVTGASGFIGAPLIRMLSRKDYRITAIVRKKIAIFPAHVSQIIFSGLFANTDYSDALKNITTVIHLAARVHVMKDGSQDPLSEFRKVNVEGTLNLAKQAAESGVKRFVFLSSIGVNGRQTFRQSYTEKDEVHPHDPYSISKHEAELALMELSQKTRMEVVIIRPPLVYACHAPGNFKTLVKWLTKGVPLPFGAIHNKRSLVALDNLVDFIMLSVEHPKAANQTFLISDGEDVSTTQLLRKVGDVLGKPARLIPLPEGLMRLAAKLMGKSDVADRLFGSLQVDSSKARDLLGWEPVITMDDQLKKTAEAYQNEKNI